MNIYDLPQLPLSEELTTILAQSENVIIERIISTGQTSDWYDQSETEFVALLQGKAKIKFENKTVTMSGGDTLVIQPHERHRVTYTSSEPSCIWICVFY
ncbi:MAG: cupin domain-containing protein [Oscillospiraceae bacterium]|nr:cupin domain-containing protein [Oscillospiraceae bacterium]